MWMRSPCSTHLDPPTRWSLPGAGVGLVLSPRKRWSQRHRNPKLVQPWSPWSTGWWCDVPILKNMRSSMGFGWHPIYEMESHNPFMFQSPPTSFHFRIFHDFPRFWPTMYWGLQTTNRHGVGLCWAPGHIRPRAELQGRPPSGYRAVPFSLQRRRPVQTCHEEF